jgi:hypothetical protein
MESNQSQNKRIRLEEDVTNNAIVELNVGGKTFATSRETLLNHGSTYFERLLESGESGGIVVRGSLRDKDGRLFIDRNPDLFGHILEYMRISKVPPHYENLPTYNNEKKALIEEARYYQLGDLETHLKVYGGGYDATNLSYEDIQIRNQAADLREAFQEGRDDVAAEATNALIPLFDPVTGKLVISQRYHKPCTSPEATILFEKCALVARKSKPHELPQTLDEFRKRFLAYAGPSFQGFSFGKNVVVAGGAVLSPLLAAEGADQSPLLAEGRHPEKGDVDLFLVASNADEARTEYDRLLKHFALENRQSQPQRGDGAVENASINHHQLLVVRSQYAVTLVVGYPQRHAQIILAHHRCAAEAIFNFDIDCCQVLWDGSNVYATPSGLRALVSGTNLADPERRTINYETRLTKYANRGFLVAVPGLDLQRVQQKYLRDDVFTFCEGQLKHVNLKFNAPSHITFSVDQEEIVGLPKLLVLSTLYGGCNLSAFEDDGSEYCREAEACLPFADDNRKRHAPGKIYLVDSEKMIWEQHKFGKFRDWKYPTPPHPPPLCFQGAVHEESESDSAGEGGPLIEYNSACREPAIVLHRMSRKKPVSCNLPIVAWTFHEDVREGLSCPEIEDAQVQYQDYTFPPDSQADGKMVRYLQFVQSSKEGGPWSRLGPEGWTDGTYYST